MSSSESQKHSVATVFTAGLAAGSALVLLAVWLRGASTSKRRPSHGGSTTDKAIGTSSVTVSTPSSAAAYATVGFLPMDHPRLARLEQDFRMHTSMLHKVVKHFSAELKKGLVKPGETIKALPSFVTKRPSGAERGTYLALDLGGTNLRVCEVVLEGHGKFRMRQKKFTISEEIKTSDAKAMFDFIADVVDQFLVNYRIEGGRLGTSALKMGFTFSFPVDQTALDVGTLMHWNKGFDTKGVVGKDVVGLLRAAFERKSLNIHIIAVVNDTVGTLIAHAYNDPETYVGVILGTGTNAAYVERVENIPKWMTHYDGVPVPSGEMIINIEWGAFDNEKAVLPVTAYDNALDVATENPGKQIFEKMISGMYLGEISRLILLDLIDAGALFQNATTPPRKLHIPHAFETQYMSRIERDHSMDLADTNAVLEDLLGVKESTLLDRQIVKRVCELVGIRSARLSAAAVAGVLTRMNKLNGCTIAIDGSVFEHYPHFKNRMSDALREIFGVSADNINLCLARDGSGVGAALIAAVMGEEFNVVSAVKTTATATTETVTAGTMTVEAPVAPSPSGRLTPKLFRKK